jgi:hypothetical protein
MPNTVEQTSPAPVAPPAGGAIAPEQMPPEAQGQVQMPQPQAQRPDIQTLLSSLTASGKGAASVRTVNRR